MELEDSKSHGMDSEDLASWNGRCICSAGMGLGTLSGLGTDFKGHTGHIFALQLVA